MKKLSIKTQKFVIAKIKIQNKNELLLSLHNAQKSSTNYYDLKKCKPNKRFKEFELYV